MDGIVNLSEPFAAEIGFTADKFFGYSFLWREGDRVLMSFVATVLPGCGDFRRMCEAILARGLTVAIPSPIGRMRLIVERSGYERTIEKTPDGDAVEVWILRPMDERKMQDQKRGD